MNKGYLLLGGNIGDRESHLAKSKERLMESECGIIKCSSIYETDAWGKTDEPKFLNQAIEFSTRLNADMLLKTILNIEEGMGRIRTYKNASRNIDIDILFFNNEIINTKGLIIPHPEIAQRRFVLMPMVEIAPNLLHPVLQKTISELLDNCTDQLPVNLFKANHEGH